MNSPADTAAPLIRLHDVAMVREHRRILTDVNLTVNAGDFLAITGPNGGGKTTLLRIILGLVKPTRGTVAVEPGIAIGYLPQKNMIDSHFPITVRETVESGLLATGGLDRAERSRRVDEALHTVGMQEHASRSIGYLSGGQLQRTLLARAIVSRPALLALDEPLSYIDKHFETHLYGLIEEISRHATILLVSHEMSTIASMANRHIIVEGGVHECTAARHYIHSECDE